MLVVTTENLVGYEIRAVIGEVLGVSACSRNPFAVGLKSPNGGVGIEMAQFLVASRGRAIGQMVHAARSRGATAIVGMRFDHRDITATWIELCAYGTAVVALPISEEARQQETLMRDAAASVPASPSALPTSDRPPSSGAGRAGRRA